MKKDISMMPVTDKREEQAYEKDSIRKPPPGYNEEEKSYTNMNVDKECRM